ncbi:MAG: hypothetical protein PHI97_07495 [Desulfobulbus sp.]|nr:hypothetical protein [Desulfobulbus sp.]
MIDEEWTLGNTLKLSYVSQVLNVKQSNLDRIVKDSRMRRVKIAGEKYERVPLWDVLQLLQQEHIELTNRKSQIEQYVNHLGNVYVLYQELYGEKHQPSKSMQDLQSMVEELRNGGN